MPVRIDHISQTKKGRIALFAEEGFLFSVDSETFVKYNIGAGIELTDAEMDELLAASDLRRCKDKALLFLSLRAYGSCELYEKLCRDFDPETAAAAVAQMQGLGLLDDAAFAVRRAEYLQKQKKSKKEIAQKLCQLGLDREDIDAALDALPEEGDAEALRRLIEGPYAAKLEAGQTEKVKAALLRRGFSYGQIERALKDADAADPAEYWD